MAELREPAALTLCIDSMSIVKTRLDIISEQTSSKLKSQGFNSNQIITERYLNLRYQGTDSSVMILEPSNGDFRKLFELHYEQEFGFKFAERDIIIDDVRVRCIGKSASSLQNNVFEEIKTLERKAVPTSQIAKSAFLGRPNFKN